MANETKCECGWDVRLPGCPVHGDDPLLTQRHAAQPKEKCLACAGTGGKGCCPEGCCAACDGTGEVDREPQQNLSAAVQTLEKALEVPKQPQYAEWPRLAIAEMVMLIQDALGDLARQREDTTP